MNLKNVLLVYGKEFRDIIRDRRTIIWSIVFPVLVIPLLMFGVIGLMATVIEKARVETISVVLQGDEHSPELARRIRSVERFSFVDPPADLRAAIGDKQIRAAVEIPSGFDETLAAGGRPEVVVYYHEGELKSESAVGDVRKVAGGYRQELLSETLAGYGLAPDDLEPFAIRSENLASKEQVTGRAAGGILPYIIILMALVGAMFPAIDLTAGEKERGTIETILASSVARLDLVLGKFLTVMTASVATVVLSLGSLAITAVVIVPRMVGDDASEGLEELISLAQQVNSMGLLGMLVLILPLTMLFSAVLMSVALFARSHREAQQYVGPLPMVVIVPALIGMLPGIELTSKTALIPITSTSLASKELLAGSFDWTSLAIIFGSSCLYAAVALFVAVKQFQRESVLFRT
jgi:sodium transport system permease protein